jgi:hypothetical protein
LTVCVFVRAAGPDKRIVEPFAQRQFAVADHAIDPRVPRAQVGGARR